jgi:colicin import membrane protein
MSTAALYESSWHESSRHEPYRLPAGILALAVHGAFFALLYFGFSWQNRPLEMMRVDLWQNLPETVEAPLEKPAVVEVVPPAAQPVAQPVKIDQPEIELPGKKKPVQSPDGGVETKRTEKQPVMKETAAKPVDKKPVGQQVEDIDQEVLVEAQQAELVRAEQAAAKGRVMKEYTDKIRSKIKSNIVLPPGVPDDALAVFRVTLLPGGSVFSIEKKKSSGKAAYDNAVERAIYKSDPLPLPPDPAMFKDFRILELKFQPKE